LQSRFDKVEFRFRAAILSSTKEVARETLDFMAQPPEAFDENESTRQQVMQHAREVPEGRVISYGALGKRCDPPISGYICGRIMNRLKDENRVPWWRVVGKDGKLPIVKRGPYHAQEQRDLLANENVSFDEDGAIERRFFVDEETAPTPQLGLDLD
jgi:methylated-DNA-protein-cysteine methyltransferase-like protein